MSNKIKCILPPILALLFILVGCYYGSVSHENNDFVNSDNNPTTNPFPSNSVPATPAGLTASVLSSTSIQLSWTAVSDATSYNIYWSTTAGVTTFSGTKISNAASPYTMTGLSMGTTYYFIVSAVNANVESIASSQVSAIPTPWSALGSGMNSDVWTLAFDSSSGNLYAGGNFGGFTENNIVKWDGTSWSSLGSGLNGPVYALVIDSNGNLYAGGLFTTAGGVTVNNIAEWPK